MKRRNSRIRQPGKPEQNACVERFNRTVRYEWLPQYCWSGLDEIRSSLCNGCGATTMNVQTWLGRYDQKQ